MFKSQLHHVQRLQQQLRWKDLQRRPSAQPRMVCHHQRQTNRRSGENWLILEMDLDPVIDLVRMAAGEELNTLWHVHALHIEIITPLSVHKPMAAQRTIGAQQRRKHARDVMQVNSNMVSAFLLHGRGSGRSIGIDTQFQRQNAAGITQQLA